MRFFAIASLVFAAATSVFAGPVIQRGSSPAGVATILTNLNSQVKPLTTQLSSLASAQVTADDIKPTVDSITSAVQTAISDLKALAGQSTSVILASADGEGAATVSEIAALLEETIDYTLTAVGTITGAVTGDVVPAVMTLLVAVGQILCELLQAVGELVGGVLALVSGVLEGLAYVIDYLDLAETYSQVVGYSISN